MPAWRDLQSEFAAAVLGADAPALLALFEPDGLAPSLRLEVHRTNVMVSLTDALAATFPAVCRLVHNRFFAYAASAFVRAHPPAVPMLALYGAAFADFLAEFPPCRDLAYLADVARLEWQINLVSQAPDAPRLAPASLGAFPPDELSHLVLRLQPALALLASPWPVDRIWEANRAAAAPAAPIDLAEGEVWLELSRRGGALAIRRFDRATFVFRAALQTGETLAQASEKALACDGRFDLCHALRALFADGSVTDVHVPQIPSQPAVKETLP